MKTLTTIVAVALTGVASLARAEAPTTRPARTVSAPTTAPTRSDALQNFRERLAQSRQANSGIDFSKTSHEPPTPQEWKQIAQFFQQQFPNRWKVFVKIQNQKGDDSEVVQAIKLKLATRYRGLKAAESDMPDVYQTALDQGQLEDTAFGTLIQLKKDPQNADLQKQLRDNVQVLVNSVLQERANRLARLQEVLDHEQQALDAQRGNIDELIDRQVRRLTSDQPYGGGFGPGGGNGGFGPGGRRRFGPGGPPSDGDRQPRDNRSNPSNSNVDQQNAMPADPAPKAADGQ